jgi:predicted HAD superfamily Cof-like phosphohydrolase
MTSNFKKVSEEFNQSFEVETHSSPRRDIWTADPSMVKFRMDLIREEVAELEEAVQNNDLVETVDALADILYVVYGAFASFGIDADRAFGLVHQSNMSKLCATEQEAKETVEAYRKGARYTPSYRQSKDGKHFIVYDLPTSKILKSIRYSPVDLKPLV